MNFEFDKIVKLLGRSENDPEVRNFFGRQMSNIERDEFYGSLEFKPDGVDVVFQEAPWVVSPENVTDPKELYVAAFHLHREGHEGYAGYSKRLPNSLALNDSEPEVLRKMGQPLKKGGGNMSDLLKGPVPRWFWFPLEDVILHIQFDANKRVEMVTPRTPDVNLARSVSIFVQKK
ncbi:MAG TPA: hypothetical protein VG649_00950 [Candidatus Angelobacter sp.]|jgi:hypothetical protein|nr:hypothetical protein [Candidatus Angelobacter sp.]